MRKRKQRQRHEGVVQPGDRVSFIMPGEDYVTAGTVMSAVGNWVVVNRLAALPEHIKNQTTLQFSRGLVIGRKAGRIKPDGNEKPGRGG